MDKYEFKLKVDEMKALVSARNYNAAAEIAETINWRKIRNLNALVLAGEVFEQVERYEESKEILLLAYDKSPIGRNIIYRLAEIAIKTKNFEEAQEYYDEFVDIAPHDNLKFVLKYKMTAASGRPYKEQIQILEELKEQEYSEEWAYELAYLYHRDQQPEKCVEACDELILWFGDGIYVEKALELKMHYQALTKPQEEKYQMFRQKRTGVIEVKPNDFLESGEIVNEPVQIPSVEMSAARYNTANLQQEIARGMQQIANATEREGLSDGMDSIQKLVEGMPYQQEYPAEGQSQAIGQFNSSMHQILQEDPYRRRNQNRQILQEDSYSQNPQSAQEYGRQPHSAFQDRRGQQNQSLMSQNQGSYGNEMSQRQNEQRQREPLPLVNQMSIEEILAEWEKTKQATQQALQESEGQSLENVKEKVLLDAEKLMERLMSIVPQLTSDPASQQLELSEGKPEEVQNGLEEAGRIVAGMNKLLQEQIDSLTAQQSNEQAPLVHQVSDPTREMPKLPDYLTKGKGSGSTAAQIDNDHYERNGKNTSDMDGTIGIDKLKTAESAHKSEQQLSDKNTAMHVDNNIQMTAQAGSSMPAQAGSSIQAQAGRDVSAQVGSSMPAQAGRNMPEQAAAQAGRNVPEQAAAQAGSSMPEQAAVQEDKNMAPPEQAAVQADTDIQPVQPEKKAKQEALQKFEAAKRAMMDAMRELQGENADADLFDQEFFQKYAGINFGIDAEDKNKDNKKISNEKIAAENKKDSAASENADSNIINKPEVKLSAVEMYSTKNALRNGLSAAAAGNEQLSAVKRYAAKPADSSGQKAGEKPSPAVQAAAEDAGLKAEQNELVLNKQMSSDTLSSAPENKARSAVRSTAGLKELSVEKDIEQSPILETSDTSEAAGVQRQVSAAADELVQNQASGETDGVQRQVSAAADELVQNQTSEAAAGVKSQTSAAARPVQDQIMTAQGGAGQSYARAAVEMGQGRNTQSSDRYNQSYASESAAMPEQSYNTQSSDGHKQSYAGESADITEQSYITQAAGSFEQSYTSESAGIPRQLYQTEEYAAQQAVPVENNVEPDSVERQIYPAGNPDVDLRQTYPSAYTGMDEAPETMNEPDQSHMSLASRPKFRTQAQIQAEESTGQQAVHKNADTEDVEEFSEEDMASAAQAAGFYQNPPQPNVPDETQIKHLTSEQRGIFSYFVLISGMESQIYDLLKGVSDHLLFDKNSISGNIIVEGIQGSGKTVLIKNIIMCLQRQVKRPNGKIGKIDANALNQKDLDVLTEKISGGCLIIESAGKITRETAVKLSGCMERDHTGTLYILEDTKQGILKALERDSSFAAKFTEKITIPLFTNDELVAFGRAYANDLDYDIDEMGVLALYKRINSIQKLDHVTTLTEVKEIVDEAIENAEKGVLKKVFGILTSTRSNDDNYVILREKDFEA